MDHKTQPTHQRVLAVLVMAVMAVGLSACNDTYWQIAPCQPIDFDRAEVLAVPSSDGQPAYHLTVTGTGPPVHSVPAGQKIFLRPVTYVQRPDYWQFNLQVCPGSRSQVIPGNVPFGAAALVTPANIGRLGVAVHGLSRTLNVAVPPYPPGGVPRLVDNWRVTGVAGGVTGEIVPVESGTRLTLDIRYDGRLGGQVCNSYTGRWSPRPPEGEMTRPTPVTISDVTIVAPVNPCPSGPSELLSRYMGALERTDSWAANEGHLTLTGPDGRTLVTASLR